MSIFSSLQPEAHLNHNSFDLSKRDVFSTKVGIVTPCFIQHTIPDSVYDLSAVNQVQLPQPMQAANFARISQQIEYFFVPYTQLWTWFEPFYYQTLDSVRNPSNVQSPSVPQYVPTFDLYALFRELASYYVVSREIVNLRLMRPDLVTHDVIAVYSDKYLSSYIIGYDMEEKHLIDVHGRFCLEDILRNLDLLGYGNFLPYCKQAYNYAWLNLDVSNTYAGFNDLSQWKDTVLNINSNFQDFLADNDASFAMDSDNHKYVSAWPILAYLKVWSDWFRSVQYDDTNYAYYFNLDHILNPTQGDITLDQIICCLQPRYKLYKRDIFTGTYPNAQFGDVAVAGLQNPTSISTTNAPSNRSNVYVGGSSDVSTSGKLFLANDSSTVNSWSVNTGVSALAIRQAEALQRFKEKHLRAGKRLLNQQTAFFGDKSRFLADHYSDNIGSLKSNVIIKDVVAQSETSELNLGDRGSYGESAVSGKIQRYVSHDFGVIIGLMYFYPETEYENFGINPHNTKIEKFDFFNADFQNLGLAPVLSSQNDIFSQNDVVLGYSSRYHEYKTAVDRVHGELNKHGVFSYFVTPRDVEDFNAPKLPSLYVNPNDVDRIFYTSADNLQSSDHFIVNMYHKETDILPMSVTGLPY